MADIGAVQKRPEDHIPGKKGDTFAERVGLVGNERRNGVLPHNERGGKQGAGQGQPPQILPQPLQGRDVGEHGLRDGMAENALRRSHAHRHQRNGEDGPDLQQRLDDDAKKDQRRLPLQRRRKDAVDAEEVREACGKQRLQFIYPGCCRAAVPGGGPRDPCLPAPAWSCPYW